MDSNDCVISIFQPRHRKRLPIARKFLAIWGAWMLQISFPKKSNHFSFHFLASYSATARVWTSEFDSVLRRMGQQGELMNSQACGLLSITWWPLVKDISGTPYCPENSYSCHGQSRSTYNYKEKEKNYYTAWGFNIGRSSSGSLGLLTCALRISNRWEPATIQSVVSFAFDGNVVIFTRQLIASSEEFCGWLSIKSIKRRNLPVDLAGVLRALCLQALGQI
ncbi:hypothetical protein V6N11_075540 [Hibiscus sabdariffa]|uniref:Uncharacterized protein n=1 Tax=Hibiscus sabdariffa TaxID=183260 RepID=A0ABR2R6V3_9ROSI